MITPEAAVGWFEQHIGPLALTLLLLAVCLLIMAGAGLRLAHICLTAAGKRWQQWRLRKSGRRCSTNVIIPGRFVVCAANRAGDFIVTGARHFDRIMHLQIKQLCDMHCLDSRAIRWEQGFIDTDGVFMDRYEALKVATEAGQINTRRRKTSPTDRLFSEDLY